MIFIEGLLLGAHGLVAGIRLRDHHHDGMRQGAAAEHQHFQGVVEHARIAAALVDDGQNLLDIRVEQVGFEQAFAGMHPVDVAAQRIDLAVVAQVAVGMRPRPVGKRVRAETRVHHRQSRFNGGVDEVGIVFGELVGIEHALVDKGFVRQARHIKHVPLLQVRCLDRALDALADDV